jgi:glycosyltransferase involved in cell wall biosynthesis
MRLLIVSGRLGVGGAERFVSNLLSFIDDSIITPSLCLLENRIDYPLPEKIPVSILPAGKKRNYFQIINYLHKVIEKYNPDVIISNIALVNRLTGAALRKINQPPYWIARIGNHPAKGGRSWWRNRANMYWDKYAYQSVDRFLVNSRGLLQGLAAVHPCSQGKTTVIYNPVDFQALEEEARMPPSCQKSAEKQLIIAVGRFHRQKRYDLMIRAFSEIRRQENVELWICGDGYLRTQIEQDINRYNLEKDVRLLGYTANPFPLMRQADLFLMTSDWEGMPNALVEAMGLGIAAVTTDCEFGPGEIIEHEVNGLLATPGNPEQVAAMSLDLLRDREKRLKLAEKGQERVRSLFNREQIMRQWTDFLLT